MFQQKESGKFKQVGIALLIALTAFAAFGQTAQPNATVSPANDKKAQIERLVIEAKNLKAGQSAAGYRKAIENLIKVRQLSRELNNTQDEGFALQNIGFLYNTLGEQQKALDYYNQSLTILRALKNPEAEAQTLHNIAYVYEELGENATALDYYNQAMKIFSAINKSKGRPENYGKNPTSFKGLGDREAEAATLNSLGSLYAKQKDYRKALDYFELALPLTRASGDPEGEAAALNNIGRAYDDLREFETSLGYYNHALLIVQAMKDRMHEAATLNNIGAVYEELGDKQKALDYYNQTLLIYRTLEHPRGEAIILNNLMLFYKAQNNRTLAVFYGKQSVNKYQQLRRAIKDLNREQQKTYLKTVEKTYQTLADILVAEGRFKEAQAILALLKEQEYFQYTRGNGDNENKDKKDEARLKPAEQKLAERYDALASRISETGAEFQTLDDKKRRLPDGENLSGEEQKRYDALAAALTDANAAFKLFLEKEIVAELGKPVKKEIDIDRSLQDKLRAWGNGTVALYTIAGAERYRVILTTPNIQVDGKTEIKSADLNRKIFAFRAALQNPSIDPRPLGKELYDILVKPIEKDLQAANAKTLVWSLDGTLRYIPLAALSPDGKTYLVEKYQTAIITQATRQNIAAANEKNWRTLGLGVSLAQTVADPILTGEKLNFSALPGVKTELAAIVRDERMPNETTGLLAGKKLIDNEFSAKSFGDALLRETADGKRRYTIVHIASHFRLGDDAANSFLLLGGGNTLTLEQISNSPEMKFGDVELVTLSACNTAFGDDSTGKEVDSLATFIELRGAKAILATLWSVSDDSTQLLMSEFYRLHKENPNITKAEAMQKAQAEMISGKLKASGKSAGCRSEIVNSGNLKQTAYKCDANAPYSHPFYWSPFILIGNWR